jgi:hypothetical protein
MVTACFWRAGIAKWKAVEHDDYCNIWKCSQIWHNRTSGSNQSIPLKRSKAILLCDPEGKFDETVAPTADVVTFVASPVSSDRERMASWILASDTCRLESARKASNAMACCLGRAVETCVRRDHAEGDERIGMRQVRQSLSFCSKVDCMRSLAVFFNRINIRVACHAHSSWFCMEDTR